MKVGIARPTRLPRANELLVKWITPSAGAAYVRGSDPRVSYPRHEIRAFPMLKADAEAGGLYANDITLAQS